MLKRGVVVLVVVVAAAIAAATLFRPYFDGLGQHGLVDQAAKDASEKELGKHSAREPRSKEASSEQRAKDPVKKELSKHGSWQQLAKDQRYYQGLFSPEAKAEILSASPTPVPSYSAGGPKQIENIRQGKLFVDSRGPMQDLANVDWAATKYGRYYATQLHALVGIGAVLETRLRLPDDVAEAIAHHINDWALHALDTKDGNSRVWYEGTVVKRLANLLHLLNYTRSFGSIEGLEFEQLLYLIHLHAALLLDQERVYVFGNHGLRQDMILAATAIALPNHPRSQEMLRVASRRLEKAAHDLFTESCIWSEHAPGYIQYAIRHLIEFAQRIRSPSGRPRYMAQRLSVLRRIVEA